LPARKTVMARVRSAMRREVKDLKSVGKREEERGWEDRERVEDARVGAT